MEMSSPAVVSLIRQPVPSARRLRNVAASSSKLKTRFTSMFHRCPFPAFWGHATLRLSRTWNCRRRSSAAAHFDGLKSRGICQACVVLFSGKPPIYPLEGGSNTPIAIFFLQAMIVVSSDGSIRILCLSRNCRYHGSPLKKDV